MFSPVHFFYHFFAKLNVIRRFTRFPLCHHKKNIIFFFSQVKKCGNRLSVGLDVWMIVGSQNNKASCETDVGIAEAVHSESENSEIAKHVTNHFSCFNYNVE